MTLASRLSRGVLEALEDPSLPLELLSMPPWWPVAAVVCAEKTRAILRSPLIGAFPVGSPEARLVASGAWLLHPATPLEVARMNLTHARELAALGPRDCDLALRALAILDRLVP